MEVLAVAAGLGVAVVAALRKRSGARAELAAQVASGVVIPNKATFAAKRKALIEGGIHKMQITTDFDRTLTAFHGSNGKRGMSCHGVVESASHLSEGYKAAARGLFSKYFPMETDPALSRGEKIPFMYEWYHQGHDLLIKEGFNRSDVDAAVAHAVGRGAIQLRPGMPAILEAAETWGVPLLVFSAGIGNVLTRIIAALHKPLPRQGSWVVSNFMKFDEGGALVDFSSPLIHMFNKDVEHLSQDYQEAVAGRPHVLLMGDSLGDVTMADGQHCPPEVVLRVGFLNDRAEALLPAYMQAYDVVVLGDGPAALALDIVQQAIAVDQGGSTAAAPPHGAGAPAASALAPGVGAGGDVPV